MVRIRAYATIKVSDIHRWMVMDSFTRLSVSGAVMELYGNNNINKYKQILQRITAVFIFKLDFFEIATVSHPCQMQLKPDGLVLV